MNKRTLMLILGIVIVAGAYVFVMKNDTNTAPETNNIEPVTEAENRDYIGLTTSEAEAKAESEGVLFRVVMEDGEPKPTTRDFRLGRISATVEEGVVTGYTVETLDPAPEENEESEAGAHDAIIGMTVEDAQAYAEEKGVGFRTGSIDGQPMAVTLDFRPGRITADVVDGVIVDYSVE